MTAFGKYLISGGNEGAFLDGVIIEDMLSKIEQSDYYAFAAKDVTVEQMLSLFHQNSKLLAVLITQSGLAKEKLLGIVTNADVLKMNNILER